MSWPLVPAEHQSHRVTPQYQQPGFGIGEDLINKIF
jgi:hypothetical protein